LTETPKRPRSETARPPKRPREPSGPGYYKEVLTNIKIAIFKETYPEDKLTKQDQESILEELERLLRGTPTGELPHLNPTDQQSGQWLMRSIDTYRLGSGARLKAMDARNLPKPVKVALRTRDKVAQTQDELLNWIKNLNPGLHMENSRVLGRQSELKGSGLILHIDRDSLVAIQKIGYKIFKGLSQGTVRVLKDPEVQKRRN
jgi:hypothetical protein